MLTRKGLFAVVVALVVLLTGISAQPASAEPVCIGDGSSKVCIDDGSGSDTLPDGSTDEGSTGHNKPVCTFTQVTPPESLPCVDGNRIWLQDHQCYATVLDPAPPLSDSRWDGHTDGVLVQCFPQLSEPITFWLPGPPQPTIDPLTLVYRGIAQMQLRAIRVGIVPEPGANRQGLVGLPVWMWTADPGPSTLGPNSRTLTLYGTTATMTAHVVRTDWSMGDGHVVACAGAGTPYEDRFGARPSPTCGHRYERPSSGRPGDAYPVTATTHWVVDWTGSNGDSGQIRFNLVARTALRVGESQALVG